MRIGIWHATMRVEKQTNAMEGESSWKDACNSSRQQASLTKADLTAKIQSAVQNCIEARIEAQREAREGELAHSKQVAALVSDFETELGARDQISSMKLEGLGKETDLLRSELAEIQTHSLLTSRAHTETLERLEGEKAEVERMRARLGVHATAPVFHATINACNQHHEETPPPSRPCAPSSSSSSLFEQGFEQEKTMDDLNQLLHALPPSEKLPRRTHHSPAAPGHLPSSSGVHMCVASKTEEQIREVERMLAHLGGGA